ncbi:hypothetical protein FQN60_013590 [Etheostoma spectabile]|uniref:Methyltransferase domain-containing protein n=1 Tax=Etheostoma spectabile TaxID=54343 RepID=A0A5J5CFD0_9PERO|nr:hypothetical protein FQN60_013590 [Etheostoma spectabile]
MYAPETYKPSSDADKVPDGVGGGAKTFLLARCLVPNHLLTNVTADSLVSRIGNWRAVFKNDLCVIQTGSQTPTASLLLHDHFVCYSHFFGSFLFQTWRNELYENPYKLYTVLERERHDAPCSSSSHQVLDVGCGQGENEALLPTQVSACVEGDEDGLVHAWRCTGHHTANCIGQLLGYQERLQRKHKTHIHRIISSQMGNFFL